MKSVARWPESDSRRWLVCATLAASAALGACDQPPSAASLKAWTAEDHHSNDDDKGSQVAATSPSGASGAQGDAQLVDIVWRQQCTSCHGPLGRGDGQMGPMVHAPDLSRADWQSAASDTDIATVIRSGRNKMPRFELPEPVLKGLVARIRALRGR